MIPISYRKLTHVCIGAGTFFVAEFLAQHFFPGAFPDQKFLVAVVVVFLGGLATALLASKWLLGETAVAAFLFSFALSAEDIGMAAMSMALPTIAGEIFAFVCISWLIIVFGLAGSSFGFAAKAIITCRSKTAAK